MHRTGSIEIWPRRGPVRWDRGPAERGTNHVPTSSRPRTTTFASLTAAAALLACTPTATAAPIATHRGPPGGSYAVASGLDNPRHLTFGPDGRLYVAESGRGGSGPCVDSPEGGQACLGATGSVTAIWRGGAYRRVVTGLPSLAGPDGSSASGPADVAPTGRRQLAVAIGLGGSPATRATLGAAGSWLGTIVSTSYGKPARTTVVSDIAAYEAKRNPDGGDIDSNTSGFVATRHGFAVTDAGGNDLIQVGKHGKQVSTKGKGQGRWGQRSTTLAVFPDRLVDSPPDMGLPPQIPMQAVPTGVAVGPDGAYYVSQLTGFPFPVGASTIWRVVPGHAPRAYATGFTNVTDLTWSHGRLYVVQLADRGLLASGAGLPMGSLIEITPGGARRTVARNLPAPYGVAVAGATAYVTTCSVCAGGGGVRAISLR